MASVKELPIAARKKIEKPENWTQNYSAKDVDGSAVYVCSPEAVCWCTLGAIRAVSDDRGDLVEAACNKLYDVLDDSFITIFNDTHTHEEVLALFDRAIANAH